MPGIKNSASLRLCGEIFYRRGAETQRRHQNNLQHPITFRQQVITACLEHLEERILDLQSQLRELTAGAENDSKSSAGDKHETSRAMMQLEHENISRQLDGFLKEKNELAQLHVDEDSLVSKGSIVRTNKGLLFLGIALGKIIVESSEVMTISPHSPLGSKLLGLQAGDILNFNNMQYHIEEII